MTHLSGSKIEVMNRVKLEVVADWHRAAGVVRAIVSGLRIASADV